MNGQADMTKLRVHFSNFANAPKNYIFILMVNVSNDSLEIRSRLKKLKITFVWKHEYSVIINGCPEEWTRASFSVMVEDIATGDDVGLLHDLNGKTLVRSIRRFLLCQYLFSESFTQNSE
jgi:hypothetical protein